METAVWLLLAYFGVLSLSLVFRKRTFRGPWLFLFRAFFPNWQFFHKVGSVPHLYIRYQDALGAWSEWQWVYPRRTRHWADLFHNPQGNLLLAQQNLVDHLSSDIKDLGEGADVRRRAPLPPSPPPPPPRWGLCWASFSVLWPMLGIMFLCWGP